MPETPNDSPIERLRNFALATAAAQAGCTSVVIVIGCLLIGLALDARLGTRPLLTLVLIVSSIPVSLVVMLRLVLGAAKRISPPVPPTAKKEDSPWQEKD